MKYRLVESKAGWVVQNTSTYSIVAGPYDSKTQASAVCFRLSTEVKKVVKEVEAEVVYNLNTVGDK